MTVRVKICGLKTPETVAAAVAGGAAYIGFNFVTRSVRSVTVPVAAALATDVPPGVAKVALVMDADDAVLDAIVGAVPLDMLQLHGAETPARVMAVKARYGLPVIKALGIASADDLAAIGPYVQVADQILVDAKAPKADLPGGNGLAFDWTLLTGRRWPVPWMLAGGLHAGNLAEAVRLTGARQVDLASGAESTPGVKDVGLIGEFLAIARGL
jgi:phosphoribosylanthranilate isomerase